MIVVYASKPFVSKIIAPPLLEKYPQQKIVYIHSMYFTNVSFDYPKNIKWKDFPYLQQSVFKISDIKNWRATTLIDGKLEPIDISFQDIVNCKKIIYAAEPDSTDSYLFSEFIEVVFNKTIHEINIDAMILNCLADADVLKSIDNMSNFAEIFKDLINQGKVKKYFDYNFNFNSFALLGKAYQHINKIFGDDKNPTNDFGKVFTSKNMLQLLYFVRQQQNNNINYREGSLVSEMQKWKGTGKYNFRARIGNPASSTSIIENLITLKLLDYQNKNIFITEKGKKFLQLLPKDCMDYDLPFRIELWAQQPFEVSKIKMDNYLNSYYRKIKNKLKEFDKLYR